MSELFLTIYINVAIKLPQFWREECHTILFCTHISLLRFV